MNLYKIIIATLMGLTCFLEVKWPLVFHIQGVPINIIWHQIFPLMILRAWGTRYAVIALTLGLSGFSFLLYWPNEGWSSGWSLWVNIIHYYLWIGILGFCQEKRQHTDRFYYKIYFVSMLFSVVTGFVYTVVYPFAYQLGGYEPKSEQVFMVIAGKGIVNQLLDLAIAEVLLLFPSVRSFLHFSINSSTRYNSRIIVGAVLSAIVFFVLTVALNNILIDGNFSLNWLLSPGEKVRMTLLLYIILGVIVGGCIARLFQNNLEVVDLLRQSEERFRFAVEASENVIFDVQIKEDRYVKSSTFWENTKFNWMSNDSGAHEEWIHPDDRERRAQILQDHFDNKIELYEVQYRVLNTEGECFWILTRGKAMRDKAGKPVRMIGVVMDITAIKNASLELERCVAKRTKELRFAMDELEAFTFVVAHDLKSPLRAISGYGRFIQEDYALQLDSDGNKMVEYIRNIAGDMILLVDKLLEYSTTTQMPVMWESVDMVELFTEVFQTVQMGWPGQKAYLTVNEPVPICYGDRVLLRQVVQNILVNAFKFSKDRGETKINVACERVGGEYIFSVEDNGVGFDVEYADKLYGIFQRLHSADEFEGFGIGLATVRKIMEKHGGKSCIEGRLGEGATVYFSLPVDIAQNSSGGDGHV